MKNLGDETEVVWRPIPDSSQELAIDSRADITVYHGTRGPGKTITQLMHFRKLVGVGYGSYWRGIIFDREFKNFSDIVAQSKRFFTAFNDGAKFLESASEFKWVWPTGEELLFRHVKKLSDYENFHGHEYPWIGWNELTKNPTSELFDKLMSVNRSSFDPLLHTPKCYNHSGKIKRNKENEIVYNTVDGKPLKPIPLLVFATTNPSGPGHNWVRKRFIDVAENGVLVKNTIRVYDPKLKAERDVTRSQVAIFGSYRENIYLPAEYIAELDKLTANNPTLRDAWLYGSWEITAGGAVDDVWDKNVHVIPRFPIPHNWKIDRAMDWGSYHPFSIGWFAEANGEEVILADGSIFSPPSGSLIQFDEWYGTLDIGTNKGIKMAASDVAEGIISREKNMLRVGWIEKQPSPGPADNQIEENNGDLDSIALMMGRKGVYWEKSDKTKGSRVNGLQLLRDRLLAAKTKDEPAIYFMRNCKASIETIPALPRDEVNVDDVDTDAEDHPYDMVRYRCLKGNNRYAEEIKVKFVT